MMMMDGNRRGYWRSYILGIYFTLAATSCCMLCDGRNLAESLRGGKQSSNAHIKSTTGMNMLKRFGIVMPVLDSSSSSNTQPYGVGSPFNLPPYESLPPFPLPDNAPPFCFYPPQPPSTTTPTPVGAVPSPPSTTTPTPAPVGGGSTPFPPPPSSSAPELPNPPEYVPSPPINLPSPTGPVLSPPMNFPSPTGPVLSPPFSEPSPPSYTPSPAIIVPSPPQFVPRTPVFLPPVVYPPPAVAPPHHTAPPMALWCVAKPSVPEPIIQEAMNYACASGADCDQIEPSGSCYQPDTVLAHASYAFNSYWQRTKVAGGTCHFGGAAILVTVDPSYDGCHFLYF